MGLFSVDVELEGPTGRERVAMLVDSDATYSAISADLAKRLGLPQNRQETFEFADGRRVQLAVVEARVRVDGRETPTLAVITEGKPLLGAFALEGLGLAGDPRLEAPRAGDRIPGRAGNGPRAGRPAGAAFSVSMPPWGHARILLSRRRTPALESSRTRTL